LAIKELKEKKVLKHEKELNHYQSNQELKSKSKY